MPDTYWIRNRGRTHGPYTTEQLQQLAARGQFGSAFQISEDGLNWERAAAYPELFAGGTLPLQPESGPRDHEANSASGGRSAPQGPAGPAASPATSGPKWRYETNGQPSDPMDFDQIRSLAAQGVIRPDGLVWNESLPNWIRAKDVPLLAFPSAPEPDFGRHPSPVRETSTETDAPAPLSQLAIASFVCGVVGVGSGILFVPLGLLAVVFGHVTLYTQKMRDGELRGKGLAIAGLTIGWCCLLILPIIAYFAAVAFFAAFSAASSAANP